VPVLVRVIVCVTVSLTDTGGLSKERTAGPTCEPALLVGTGVGVLVSVGAAVSVAVGVGVLVLVSVGTGVGVLVSVGTGVGVLVSVGTGVFVSVDGTTVSVAVGVGVLVLVDVDGSGVLVSVDTGVLVSVPVGATVGVGVLVATAPDSVSCCGASWALSVIESVAVIVPLLPADGRKLTPTTQLAPAY